jgi:tetratricopeptide (TPR) repeat protein
MAGSTVNLDRFRVYKMSLDGSVPTHLTQGPREPERPSDAINRPEAAAGNASQPSPEAVSATREGSPEKLRRRLKGDLDTILLKALRKERQKRYASVEQFSGDIRRHLEGLPVLARKDTLAYRTGKFTRRHATAVIAAALVLSSLAVGLVIAVLEARVARDQRTRAEQRFNDVRDLANSLLFPVYDAIEDIPGSTAARKLLVDKALHYLDSLSLEAQGDSTLQRELAAAYERIGDVQGNSLSANLGDSAGALASNQKALAIRTKLFRANPNRIEDTIGYAKALRLTASALRLNGKTTDAWKLSKQASEAAESALWSNPREGLLLMELSQDYSTQASILGGDYGVASLGNTTDAIAVRQKHVEVEERLLNLDPTNLDRQRSFAVSLAHMGDQFVLVGQRRDALPYFTRSETVFRSLAERSPGRKASEALQGIYTRLAVTEEGVGDNQAGLGYAIKALEAAKQLSQADPHDIRAQISMAIDYNDVASLRLAMNQLAQAMSSSNQAVSSVDKLVTANRGNGELPSIQAGIYESAGDILSRQGDYRKSLDYFHKGIEILSRTRSQDPENVDAALDLAGAYNELAKSLVRAHAFDKAIEIFRKAASLSEPVANGNRPNEISQYALAESYGGMGYAAASLAATIHDVPHRIVILKEAKSWYEQSLNAWANIKEPEALTPDGYNCVSPTVVKQRLASVISALGQLGKAADISRDDKP